MLRRTKTIVAGAVVVAAMLAVAPMTAASASASAAPRVAKHGSCSGNADWSPEGGSGALASEFSSGIEHWVTTGTSPA